MTLEDFTTYIKYDPNDRIMDLTSNHLEFWSIRNMRTRLYANYGYDHFGDFEHDISVRRTYSTDNGLAYCYMLANVVKDVSDLQNDNDEGIGFYVYDTSGGLVYWRLNEIYEGNSWIDSYTSSSSAYHYLTIEKVSTTLTCKIYSDVERTNLLTTLSLTLHADHKFKYVYAINTFHLSSSVTLRLYIDDLDLKESKDYGVII